MAKRLRLLFSPEDLKVLAQQRFEHPDPRVQQRFEVFLVDQPKSNAPSSSQVGRRIASHGEAECGHLPRRGRCRLATIPLVCLGKVFGQEFEYRITVPAFVFAKPELD